jgi:hypothetical protein
LIPAKVEDKLETLNRMKVSAMQTRLPDRVVAVSRERIPVQAFSLLHTLIFTHMPPTADKFDVAS